MDTVGSERGTIFVKDGMYFFNCGCLSAILTMAALVSPSLVSPSYGGDIYSLQSAMVDGNLAHALSDKGKYEEAEELYLKAIRLSESQLRIKEDPLHRRYLANNYFNASIMAWNQGRITQSFDRLHQAEAQYSNNVAKYGSGLKDQISVLEEIIRRHISIKQYSKANEELVRLFELIKVKEIKAPGLLSNAYRLSAEAAMMGEDFNAAEAALNKAYESLGTLRSDSDDPTDLLRLDFLKLRLLFLEGKNLDAITRKANDFMTKIESLDRKTGRFYRGFGIQALLLLVEATLKKGRHSDVPAEVFDVLKDFYNSSDPYNTKAKIWYLEAKYHEKGSRPQDADKCYRHMVTELEAFRMAIPVSDDLYQSEQDVAHYSNDYVRFLLSQNDYVRALEVYESSRAYTLRRIFQFVAGSPVTDSDGFANRRELFLKYQHLAWKTYALAKQLSETEGQIGVAEKRSRLVDSDHLRDELSRTTAEYKHVFHELAPLMGLQSEGYSLKQLLELLPRNGSSVVVLKVDASSNTLTEWWITDGVINVSNSHSIDVKVLNEDIQHFLEASIHGSTNTVLHGVQYSYTALAERLFSQIIPNIAKLSRNSHVTIIPDAYLQNVPFSALYFRGEPLIKLISGVSYAPSLQWLAQRHQFSENTKSGGMFVGFKSVSPNADELMFSEEDAMHMDNLFREAGKPSVLLIGSERVDDIVKEMQKRELVVIGSHGVLDPRNPMNSYIMFPERTVHAFDIFQWPLDGSQVVLSACEIGRHVAGRNEDILGTTFPIFIAGARNVTHAEWEVDQEVTSIIMRQLVSHLAKGTRVDDALVLAQRWYYDNSTPMLRHPQFWAAWRVVGAVR